MSLHINSNLKSNRKSESINFSLSMSFHMF